MTDRPDHHSPRDRRDERVAARSARQPRNDDGHCRASVATSPPARPDSSARIVGNVPPMATTTAQSFTDFASVYMVWRGEPVVKSVAKEPTRDAPSTTPRLVKKPRGVHQRRQAWHITRFLCILLYVMGGRGALFFCPVRRTLRKEGTAGLAYRKSTGPRA